MSLSDSDLLRQYAQERSEAAFAEIVRRHLDLVYSAAKRQIHSAELAEEVAQSVFVDLSRKAVNFDFATPLVAWLHVVTRRTAIDFIRTEARRRTREQSAVELATMNPTLPVWSAVEPILDEALAALNESDRAAILLRYFENKSLREIGESLGRTDDAAQKRISRAIDQLRDFFIRRGVTVTAAGFVTDLSAHAVQTAPAALAASITIAATKASTALTVAQTAKVLAMTATQKVLVTAVLLLAIGGGIFEARVISRQRVELEEQRRSMAALQREIETIRAERDDRARAFADAEDELQKLHAKTAASAVDPAVEAALDSWLQNVVRLKKALEKTPSSQIPELQFLTAKDWLDATKETTLDTDLDVRRALCQLRDDAKRHFSLLLFPALKRFLSANNQQPPTDLIQLAPFFEPAIDPAILQRYGVFENLGSDDIHFTAKDGSTQKWVIREKQTVDPYYDSTFQYSADGFGFGGRSQFDKEVEAAIASFRAANNGASPTAPAQVASYLHSAIDPAFIQKRLSRKD